ncbi:Hypothetical predicted protein, partial [Paramuricea clavata]
NGICNAINWLWIVSNESFCWTMNMPPPVGTKPYNDHTKAILRAVKDVAEKTTKDAAEEIFNSKSRNIEEIVKTGVSCDGTWQIEEGFLLLAWMCHCNFNGNWEDFRC